MALVVLPIAMMGAERWELAAPPGPAVVHLWTATPQRSVETDGPPARVLAAGPGEPLVVQVVVPGSGRVRLITGDRPAPVVPWTTPGGLVVEGRTRADGAVDTTAKLSALWERSAPQGATIVERLFLGVNPCGPSTQAMLQFDGWLRLPASGSWAWATVSQDASLVEIDGAPVVAWLGHHPAEHGTRAQHAGTLTLTEGLHRVRYLVAAVERPVLAELAWKGPAMTAWEVVPEAAWVPCPRREALPEGRAPWLSWTMIGHETLEGVTVVEVEAQAHGLAEPISWSWDDGTQAHGAVVHQLFLRPGLHQVRVTAGAITVARTVHVHPAWARTTRWSEAEQTQRWQVLMARDLERMPSEDVAPALALTRAVDGPALAAWQARLLVRARAVAASSVEVRNQMVGVIDDLRSAATSGAEVARALDVAHLVADLGSGSDPQASQAALRWAALAVHDDDRPAVAATALAAVRVATLTADERRQYLILRGDVAAGRGDMAAARAAWDEAGSTTNPADRAAAMRRRVRLERARDLVAMHHDDDALDLIRQVLNDRPAEVVEADVAVLRARVALARQQPRAALAALRPAITAAPLDDRRAEALGLFIEAATALHLADDVAAAKAMLRHDHPWSEAASRLTP